MRRDRKLRSVTAPVICAPRNGNNSSHSPLAGGTQFSLSKYNPFAGGARQVTTNNPTQPTFCAHSTRVDKPHIAGILVARNTNRAIAQTSLGKYQLFAVKNFSPVRAPPAAGNPRPQSLDPLKMTSLFCAGAKSVSKGRIRNTYAVNVRSAVLSIHIYTFPTVRISTKQKELETDTHSKQFRTIETSTCLMNFLFRILCHQQFLRHSLTKRECSLREIYIWKQPES